MMTKKQKQQTAAGVALLLLLLGWRLAHAKARPKITVGPITVDRIAPEDEDPNQAFREQRALYRNRALDLIGFDEDAWSPTRRPTTADNLVLDSIFQNLTQLGSVIPDPNGFDAGFDSDLKELVTTARALDPSTSSRPALAFGSSRYMTRRLGIEKAVQDTVALGQDGQPHRHPNDIETSVARQMIAEYEALGQKLLSIDPEADLGAIPLDVLIDEARTLPVSTSSLPAVASYNLNPEPGVAYG